MTFTDKIIKTTRTIGVDPPPVLEVKNWLVDPDLQPSKPLIDVSQAAPTEPPPKKCWSSWRIRFYVTTQ